MSGRSYRLIDGVERWFYLKSAVPQANIYVAVTIFTAQATSLPT